MTEDKMTLTRKRVELVERLATLLPPEERIRLQGELSVVNAKIKALNTTAAAQLKAAADRRKIAGLTEAQANAARARAKLGETEAEAADDDIEQIEATDAWIIDALQRGGIKVHRSSSDGALILKMPAVFAKAVETIYTLCNGIRAVARGQDLPLLWDGMCPAGKHGLDFEEQPCGLCAGSTTAIASPKARKRPRP